METNLQCRSERFQIQTNKGNCWEGWDHTHSTQHGCWSCWHYYYYYYQIERSNWSCSSSPLAKRWMYLPLSLWILGQGQPCKSPKWKELIILINYCMSHSHRQLNLIRQKQKQKRKNRTWLPAIHSFTDIPSFPADVRVSLPASGGVPRGTDIM